MKTAQRLNRRRFLRATATLTAASIVPRWVLGGPGQTPPSDRLNVGIIGTGGQGITNLNGSGTLGNYGCHALDTAVWALDLEHPTMVEASSTALNQEITPAAAMYHYVFPARGDRPPVDLFWYDGGLRPRRPACLEPDRDLPTDGGSLIVGDDGAILSGVWSGSPRIIPETKMRRYPSPPPTLPRSRRPHHSNFGHRRIRRIGAPDGWPVKPWLRNLRPDSRPSGSRLPSV